MNVNSAGCAVLPSVQSRADTEVLRAAPAEAATKTGPTAAMQVKEAFGAEATPSNKQKLQGVVETLNEFLKSVANDIEFSVEEDSGRTVVKLVDKETHEVLRQYPSKETLEIAKSLDRMQGFLIKTQV